MIFRHEHKHTINNLDAVLLKSRLKNIMHTDVHADQDGQYTVKEPVL